MTIHPRFDNFLNDGAGDERSLRELGWTTLNYEREEVNKRAKALVAYEFGEPNSVAELEKRIFDYNEALPAINNWRSSHSFPLNTFRMNLTRSASRVDSEALTAQRIKRLSSISLKLHRFPKMKLSQMQDIGGCRAVVRDIGRVKSLVDLYRTKSQVKHKIVHIDDYIQCPQVSGYRGVHLVWRYNSDKSAVYNGLKIEMQLRTALQHAWATAVETVGTFLEQALKSSIGSPQWLRFFALMGTAVADREGSPPVPGTPVSKEEWVRELHAVAEELDARNRLASFGAALQVVENESLQNAAYFLVKISPTDRVVTVQGYKFNQLNIASNDYLEAEKSASQTQTDAVLVSVNSLASLKRAYPNYFADTHVFNALVDEILRLREEPGLL